MTNTPPTTSLEKNGSEILANVTYGFKVFKDGDPFFPYQHIEPTQIPTWAVLSIVVVSLLFAVLHPFIFVTFVFSLLIIAS